MDIVTAEFLQNNLGECYRKIQLFLRTPTADVIQGIKKLQSQCLKIDFVQFCRVQTLKIMDRNPSEMDLILDGWCPDYYYGSYEPIDNMESKRGYDYLNFEKGFYYLKAIARVGHFYIPIKGKNYNKRQLLDIAINLGCVVYKSWNKSQIMRAIYPNLSFVPSAI